MITQIKFKLANEGLWLWMYANKSNRHLDLSGKFSIKLRHNTSASLVGRPYDADWVDRVINHGSRKKPAKVAIDELTWRG